ncbi:MAG: MFS transporter [Pontibacterium sp.]
MRELFAVRGFAAFLLVAFINAMVDSGHKVIIQSVLFKAYDGNEQVLLTAIVNGLVLLPFILLFSPSGYLSDRLAKPLVMRCSALLSVVIAALVTLSYWQGWFELSFALTFVLALQSALYSPAKYGFVRELVGVNQISEGNAWLQAVTMVAILLGILLFSAGFEALLAIETDSPQQILAQMTPLGILLWAACTLEAILAWRLPERPAAQGTLAFDTKAYVKGRLLTRNLGLVLSRRPVWLSIVGIAIFWTICQVLLAVYPAYAKAEFGLDNAFYVQAVMGLSGIGIMLGSLCAGRYSRHHINLSLIPAGALGLALALILLPWFDGVLIHSGVFFAVGFFGALANVPLNALMQFHSPKGSLGRVIATSNLIQNWLMIFGLSLTVAMAWLQWPAVYVIWLVVGFAVVALLMALIAAPDALCRGLVAVLVRLGYKVDVIGFEHLPESGKGVLLLGNHVSWLDWAMVQLACPRQVHFVMDKQIYSKWYLRWFLDINGVIPISDTSSRGALKQVEARLNEGKVVCIFPEGMISFTGQLGEFKKGFERATQNAQGQIVPFYLRGLWGSRFSRATRRVKPLGHRGPRRELIIAFGEPIPLRSSAAEVKQAVSTLSVSAWQAHTDTFKPLPEQLVRALLKAPTKWAMVQGMSKYVSHHKLLCDVVGMTRPYRRLKGKYVAVILPKDYKAVVAQLALVCVGKVPVMITPELLKGKYAAKVADLLAAQGVSELVSDLDYLMALSSKVGDLSPITAPLNLVSYGCCKPRSSTCRALKHLRWLPHTWLARVTLWRMTSRVSEQDQDALVFIAATRGYGVQAISLSHRNVSSSVMQSGDMLDAQPSDRLLSNLALNTTPGLVLGVWMPILNGLPLLSMAQGQTSRRVARALAFHEATLMLAQPQDLEALMTTPRLHPKLLSALTSVLLVGSHDEKANIAFAQRFGCDVLVGYGRHEVVAAVSCNLPDVFIPQWASVQPVSRQGTLGQPLPGCAIHIINAQGEACAWGEEGEICIGGAQVAQGYLSASSSSDEAASAFFTKAGLQWFKTTDRGYLDKEGYLVLTQLGPLSIEPRLVNHKISPRPSTPSKG